jgi:GNAT superfamily N-acetyltransferase
VGATEHDPAPGMIERVLELWNGALGERFPLTPALAEQFLSAAVDVDATVVEAEGMVIAKRVGPQAWIGAVVVAPARQRQGVGTRLMTHALGRLRAAGATRVEVGGDPLHLLPGIPDPGAAGFFAGLGAEIEPVVHDLRRDLTDWTAPAGPPVAEPADDWDEVIEFLGAQFPGLWTWTAEEARRRGDGPEAHLLLRREGVVRGCARLHLPGRQRLIGPSLNWAPLLSPACGGLGPIGIDERCRGEGLGLALLHAGVSRLRAQGVRDMVIDWTDLLGFYGKAGFASWQRYRPASFA